MTHLAILQLISYVDVRTPIIFQFYLFSLPVFFILTLNIMFDHTLLLQ